jgi:hypothetical protein
MKLSKKRSFESILRKKVYWNGYRAVLHRLGYKDSALIDCRKGVR